MTARVLSVNVGRPQLVRSAKREFTTSIVKSPVEGRVATRGPRLDGDIQADPRVHGGHDKAVYSYSREDYAWWEAELGRGLEAGTFGENLTTGGIDLRDARLGDRWRIGTVVLEVSQPRLPCFKLAWRMDDERFVRTFARARRPGTYLRVIEQGELGGGDAIEVVERSPLDVPVVTIVDAYLGDDDAVERMLTAPALSGAWREWAEERLARAAARTASA